MKTFKIFSTAALALMMAACSSEDTAQSNYPAQQGQKVPFSATIAAPGSGAGTRTEYTEVTTGDAAGTINVAWKAKDEIALIHNGTKDVVTVETVNEDGSATITGDITVGTNGEAVTAYYPAAAIELNSDKKPVPAEAYTENLLAQDGTLSYIASNLDLRSGESTIAVDGDKATLSDNVKLASQIAIWKLTLQDDAETPAALSATQVSVKVDGETPETIASTAKLSTATSSVYLAMDAITNETLTIEATVGEGTYSYTNEDISLAAGKYYQSTVTMAPPVTDLSTLTDNYTAKNGETLTGTLDAKVQISIAARATVTLDGVTINGVNNSDYTWAGITCEGDATIILKDGTTNTVTGFHQEYPGIHVLSGTLTIKGETEGTGKLIASSNGWGAGIGGGYGIDCGNIEIQGGKITATGGSSAAGIGSGSGGTCSDITISGGTVTATGGSNAAGIGSGNNAGCGDIKITSGVTQVTATKGSSADNSIGKGRLGYCGTVTIGGTMYWDGDNYQNGGDTYLTQSPYKYPLPALSLTNPAVGQVIGDDGKNYASGSLPSGVKAVAKICYVSGTTGLALALKDDSNDAMKWVDANSIAVAHQPAFSNGTWRLPNSMEWQAMKNASGGSVSLRNGFEDVGGTNMAYASYWGASLNDTNATYIDLYSSAGSIGDVSKDSNCRVRAVLVF